ncbi:hypothetical protein KY285_023515 [Solanum tuberosum]|nr:hypothetical protein KY289_023850 [Solanum tuberosum]KAH0675714.1 hypothetical protein KY285_023515 [Solanum tuberosum]
MQPDAFKPNKPRATRTQFPCLRFKFLTSLTFKSNNTIVLGTRPRTRKASCSLEPYPLRFIQKIAPPTSILHQKFESLIFVAVLAVRVERGGRVVFSTRRFSSLLSESLFGDLVVPCLAFFITHVSYIKNAI